MSTVKQVTVVGVGLIGGSICQTLHAKNQNIKITGFGLDQADLEGAAELGIIDYWTLDFEEAVRDADYIFLCTPVQITLGYLEHLSKCKLKETVLVTDVASTKGTIMQTAETLIAQGIDFIGGHPMAGSHKTSYHASQLDLFENAYYILVATAAKNRVPDLIDLLSETHAKFIELAPQEHDQIVGLLSHIPHIIAAGLVNFVSEESNQSELFSLLAAGGFRDITRIASSDPTMWTDILMTNREALLTQLSQWQNLMTNMQEMLSQKQEKDIYDYFSRAQEIRNQLPQHKKGSIPNLYDLFVSVPDEVGVIAKITQLLHENQLSITNIRILETRVEIFGVLQLTFRTENDREVGQRLIEEKLQYQTES